MLLRHAEASAPVQRRCDIRSCSVKPAMLGGFISHRDFDQVHVSKLVSETANFGERGLVRRFEQISQIFDVLARLLLGAFFAKQKE
jgi:hypothetical protein